MKQQILVTGPVKTRSGYGNHARDICRALIELDKYDVIINSVRWGNTPMNALQQDNVHHQKIKSRLLTSPQLSKQPDLHLHIVVPNEFTPVAKKNIGVTAGIETTIPVPQWIEGMNRMDLNIVTSEFTKTSFANASFDFEDEKTKQKGNLKINKPMEVLFEGVDIDEYHDTNSMDDEIKSSFKKVNSDWNFLFTGHWLQGGMGEDRKDIAMMIKVFCETFKNQKNQPGLILKTSSASFSVLDRQEMIKRIQNIKNTVSGKLPSIYLLHGDLTDSQMNQLYNHPKVKAHLSFTHGEGFGRPLLEATQSGKPVIASGWSGQVDFLNKNYAVLLGGSLTKVPENSFPKEMLFEQSQWFTVNYQQASQVMVDVFKNYSKYLVKSKQLQLYTKNTFNFEKMKYKLDDIISEVLKDIPQEVSLKLPKLKKIGSDKTPNLKLPKLKKA
jgi:glycosyltransferase involved in cell wall biosynthesis